MSVLRLSKVLEIFAWMHCSVTGAWRREKHKKEKYSVTMQHCCILENGWATRLKRRALQNWLLVWWDKYISNYGYFFRAPVSDDVFWRGTCWLNGLATRSILRTKYSWHFEQPRSQVCTWRLSLSFSLSSLSLSLSFFLSLSSLSLSLSLSLSSLSLCLSLTHSLSLSLSLSHALSFKFGLLHNTERKENR